MDILIKFFIRLLPSTILLWLALYALNKVAHNYELFGDFWRLPKIIGFSIILLILIFFLLKRIFPLNTTPLITNKLVAVFGVLIGFIATTITLLIPFGFFIFLWSGYQNYNQYYSESELPPNSSYINLSNTEIFNSFDEQNLDRLERYLSANKKWNVRHWKERKVAFLKRKEKEDWNISMNMYFSEENLQHRVGVYLGNNQPQYKYNQKPLRYAISGKKDFNVQIKKTPYSSMPKYLSWLWVKGENIGIEIFEETNKPQRNLTRKYLSEVSLELTKLKEWEVNKDINDLLVSGSIITAEQNSMKILDGFQPGIYQATGYINTGKKGYVYLKVFDKKSGVQLSKSETMENLNYPGWSENTNEKFHFQFEFTIYEGDWNSKYPVQIELWFKPSDDTPEEKLITKSQLINGWQR